MAARIFLIVVTAFSRDSEGNLLPAFDSREYPDEGRAILAAMELRPRYAGVIAWKRTADPTVGEYGPPEVLAQYGDVPNIEKIVQPRQSRRPHARSH